jgi:hypothetical protein
MNSAAALHLPLLHGLPLPNRPSGNKTLTRPHSQGNQGSSSPENPMMAGIGTGEGGFLTLWDLFSMMRVRSQQDGEGQDNECNAS